ncbi:hypothetical protein [Hyalangium rubrum]|uniref:Uncharacterized protein n=1 Tax=Hyalangium rubrum TaxID=3103134 RepID=A0ABU5HFZ3_9BACT|nr:hypothetical protein [Hyalangium sp. s54d21]MDY7231732.1 hypothetical protein [Hyalangium sp. s54d21]
MRQLVLLLATLALAGTAHAADDPALWKAVFQLDKPELEKKASALLRSRGAAGYDVLSKAARIGSERNALGTASLQLGCHIMGMRPYHTYGQELGLSLRAAKLATEMLQEDRALREQMLGAEEPFDRALALLVSASVQGALPGALKRLQDEKEPRVLEVVEGASRCAQIRTGDQVDEEAQQLSRRLKGTLQQPRCEQPGFAADMFLEGMISGRYKVSGWSRSGEDFSVTLSRGSEERSSLAPPCALALYDALVRKGTYAHGLVVPMAGQRMLPLATRDAAAQRAVRDLPRYPEQNRNELAAELVNAGYYVPVKVTFKTDDTFAQDEELEAAARQGNAQALATIDRHVFCRGTFGARGLALLGYLGTKEAADTAYQLAQRCPRALSAATAALLRLGDSRGLSLLEKSLAETGFAMEDLHRAVIESYTPELGRTLRELSQRDNASAKELLGILRTAGVTQAE